MFTIINTTGGVWGTTETREEAERVCSLKGYTILGDIKDAEIIDEVVTEDESHVIIKPKKRGRPFKK